MLCKKCLTDYKGLKKDICFNCLEGVFKCNPIKITPLKTNNRHTIYGLIKSTYAAQKSSSKKRGHKPPNYTLHELETWLIAKKRFHTLFDMWKSSGYIHELVPSLNRLDESIGYSFDNVELLTWSAHRKKANGTGKKKVVQTTLKGVFIKEYESCSEAARQLNWRHGANGISLVARKKQDSYLGFKFYYPES